MLTVYCAKLEEHDTSKDLTSSEIDRLKAIKFQIGNDYLKEPEAIESLLVCSRKPFWRQCFREYGLLEEILNLIEPECQSDKVQRSLLSFVANCCADNNENRAMVLERLDVLQSIIRKDPAKSVAVVVIYNLCNDWEPGQNRVAEKGFFDDLVMSLSSDDFQAEDTITPCALELLSMIVQQLKAQEQFQDVRHGTLQTIINLPLRKPAIGRNPDLVGVYFEILENPKLQGLLTNPDFLAALLAWLEQNEQQDERKAHGALRDEDEDTLPDEISAEIISAKLVSALSDISASEAFYDSNAVDSYNIATIIGWLRTDSEALFKCACLMLGNVARSTSQCELVMERLGSSAHETSTLQLLERTIQKSRDSSVTHAGMGLIGNLSQSSLCRDQLGSLGFVELIYSKLSVDAVVQDINIAALRALRLLIKNNCDNIERLFQQAESDRKFSQGPITPNMPNHQDAEPSPPSLKTDTIFSDILAQFWKLDNLNVLVEVGRLIIAVLRNVYTLGSPAEVTKSIISSVMQDKHAMKFIILMLKQNKIQAARSEAIFGAALVVRTRTGASRFAEALDDELFDLLQVLLAPEPSSEGASPQHKHDRENTMVLISELLAHEDSISNKEYVTQLKDLLDSTGRRGDE